MGTIFVLPEGDPQALLDSVKDGDTIVFVGSVQGKWRVPSRKHLDVTSMTRKSYDELQEKLK